MSLYSGKRNLLTLVRLLSAGSLWLYSSCSSVDETSMGIGIEGLRLARFPLEEGLQRTTAAAAAGVRLRCNMYFKYSEDDSDYILIVGLLDEEVGGEISFAKINGEWVRFNGILEPNLTLNLWADQIHEDFAMNI